MYEEPPWPLGDARVTDKGPRHLEPHMREEAGPSFALVSGLGSSSQALPWPEDSFLQGSLQQGCQVI